MDTRTSTVTSILIATDNVTNAALVKNMLSPEFEHVFITTDSAKGPEDYVRYKPDVLVLAFNTLKKRNIIIWSWGAYVMRFTSLLIALWFCAAWKK